MYRFNTQKLNTDFINAAKANARQILVKARFNGTTELSGNNIIDMTVTEAVNASDGLSMGATISSKLTIKVRPDGPLLLNDGFIEPYVGFNGIANYCPLGKFYNVEAKSNDDFNVTFSVTAYDGFCKTEDIYTPQITMPNTPGAILEDIAQQCNIALAPDLLTGASAEILALKIDLYEWTCRQYIGYIAGLMGKNARFDRNGQLTFVWYTPANVDVPRELQYMGGLKRLTADDFSVHSISSGTSDNPITSGSGTGISFENPLITQEILDQILASVGSLSFTPASLKWRGNPMIEAGDIITATDSNGISRTVLVMEQTLKIGGGMHSEVKCFGESEAAAKFETSPQAKKLNAVYTKLQSAIAEATKLLNGSNGGIFEIVDADGDGINDGWIIHSADGQRYIKANINGIGITTDGGATFEEAMTANGINASAIHTGQMSAERIAVGDASLGDVFEVLLDQNGHPVVIIGASDSDIKQKQTNNAITFVNSSDQQVAKFATTGAEWTDMQQIKYCGFIWTKSPTTGNVRFTKVGGGS